MDSITVLDLFIMLVASSGRGHEASMNVLRTLYEREHTYHVARLSGSLALTAGVAVVLIGQLIQRESSIAAIAVAVVVAFVASFVVVAVLAYRLRRLERNYLDIMQVYHLLARFF